MENQWNVITLITFLDYKSPYGNKVLNVIGRKTVEKDGKILVNLIWCKVCARFKHQITNLSHVRGMPKPQHRPL